MFVPNTFGHLSKHSGFNIYGEPSWAVPVKIECSVVDLSSILRRTQRRNEIKTESEENDIVCKILCPTTTQISIGDKFEINQLVTRVLSVCPRYSVLGEIDHLECDLEAWAK
jgi:hypothetical protein